ncbi:hypothetical protein F511_37487 [Dorcoceras hygrometricum]|uniref:Uncharacterized protein n=1 Tax=Dorcoceras hygrometricum TaxID=472368 RepID=A0A2Z7B0S5_9LAMI|nr:hypothetical protein F511_37487 [Dorcoceras hygrometricum]
MLVKDLLRVVGVNFGRSIDCFHRKIHSIPSTTTTTTTKPDRKFTSFYTTLPPPPPPPPPEEARTI